MGAAHRRTGIRKETPRARRGHHSGGPESDAADGLRHWRSVRPVAATAVATRKQQRDPEQQRNPEQQADPESPSMLPRSRLRATPLARS